MKFPPPVDRHRTYLRTAVEIFMTAEVEVVRPAPPIYDPVLGTALASSVDVYAGYVGRAQIGRSSSAGAVVSGESYQEISTVPVRLPADATPVPRVEDQIIVTACQEDPKLINEVLRVIDVTYGGLTDPFRTLTCTFATATPFNPSA